MSHQALIKFYIGYGTRLFSERVLDTTAGVLARHVQSEDKVSAIMEEIRVGVVG